MSGTAIPFDWAWPARATALTGRRRYRLGFRGVLILQVEERMERVHFLTFTPGESFTRWRDAELRDLTTEDAVND